MSAPSANAIRELELYKQNQSELLKEYNGKIIALHDGEVQGVYSSKTAALADMETKFPPGDFMIIKCTPGDGEYTCRFRSPVFFSAPAFA